MTTLIQPQEQTNSIIRTFAEHYELPLMGVTNMGGKPYVNAAGLMAKAKKIGLKSIKIDIEKPATKEEMTAVVRATVKLKDGSEYEDFGFGSKESIKMSTLHNPDFITMTTITRAKNRALRSATGFGLVSVEELVTADGMYSGGHSIELAETNLNNLTPPPSMETKITITAPVKKEAAKIEDAEEVFQVKAIETKIQPAPNLSDMVEIVDSKTYRENLINELMKEVELRPALDIEPILNKFMVSSLGELLEGQVEYALKWVKAGKVPQAI